MVGDGMVKKVVCVKQGALPATGPAFMLANRAEEPGVAGVRTPIRAMKGL